MILDILGTFSADVPIFCVDYNNNNNEKILLISNKFQKSIRK